MCSAAGRGAEGTERSAAPPGAPCFPDSGAASTAAPSSAATPFPPPALLSALSPAPLHPVARRAAASSAPARTWADRTDRRVRIAGLPLFVVTLTLLRRREGGGRSGRTVAMGSR
ncbi:hypothetical protein GCM10018789_13080 [Streptomyces werraensis]|nr:hypothetical protein GCM10018789_13080 [Streptomyces werraensis]